MSGMLSAVLVVTLSLALVAVPAVAIPAVGQSVPLGVVLTAQQVHARPDMVYTGATIYEGDRLQTVSGGTLVARLGSGQMVLSENSSAIVRSTPQGFSAALESGSVAVFSSEGQGFEVLADGATIRPLDAQPASGRITKVTSKELILTSTRGILEVSIGGEVKTIAAGTSYRMGVEPEESEASPHPSGTQSAGRSHFLKIVLPPAGVGIVLIIIRALESGDRL